MRQLGPDARLTVSHATKMLLWIFLFVALTQGVVGQMPHRILVLDFSTTPLQPRKRLPKPFPPGTFTGGRCGGVLWSSALSATLVSLDRNEYALGDEFTYTLNLSNLGKEPIRVPTVFNLADLEPDDFTKSFTYAPMELWLGLSDSEHRLLSILLLTLYSSDDMPSTQIALKGGEFIEIRGKARLEPTDQTNRKYYADVDSHSSVPSPMGEVKVGVMFWRGDYLHFDGRTQYEYYGCHGYESGVTLSNEKVTLLPGRVSKQRSR